MVTLRRTLLFLPGNNERFLTKALETAADGVILDLEDAVTPQEKPSAREVVGEALGTVDFRGKERVVRVNGITTEWGEEDLRAMVEAGAEVIMPPKADSAEIIQRVDRVIAEAERAHGVPEGRTRLLPLIETAEGFINVESTAKASPRIVALAFGGGDYLHSTKGSSTKDEWTYIYPRTKMLLAARAAGVMALGPAFLYVHPLEDVVASARRDRVMGFDGKTAIHPSHIDPVNEVFTPTQEEIAYARRVIEAYEAAERDGRGAIKLEGKLIEHLHATEARWLLEAAKAAGVLRE